MTQAPGPTYQCMVTSNLNQDAQGNVSSYFGFWTPSNGTPYGDGNYGASTYMPQFWVVNGKAPLTPPKYFVAPNQSTVPAGLAQALTPGTLLVAGFAGPIYGTPAGALYQFLLANGAGATLTTLEQLNATLACGIFGVAAYAMVSVAGQGPNAGIEFAAAPAPLNYAGNNVTAAQSFFAFTLFSDNQGQYLPSKSQLNG